MVSAQILEKAKHCCVELQNLPPGWTFDFDKENRAYFIKDQQTTYNNPSLGGLPKPWVLKIIIDARGGTWSVNYYNRETGAQSSKNPRFMENNLVKQAGFAGKHLQIAASSIKNTNIDLDLMRREEINNHNIRDNFEVVHAIDAGDGTLGGMNGGIFVVRIKNIENKLYIEKRFKPKDVAFGKKEIQLLYKLKHAALTAYHAAFIIEKPDPAASVYIEFCDRGSCDFIDEYCKYDKHNPNDPKPYPPEQFIWHVFGGIMDALAYLKTGSSYLHNPGAVPKPGWVPILHRDIKPDNILLKSRSTIGSHKYFYCVLSDLGLSCEDYPAGHDKMDVYQLSGLKLGTQTYYAPELCHDPYPRSREECRQFPGEFRHSAKSDVYALGLCIYALCVCLNSGNSHLARLPDNLNTVFEFPTFDEKGSQFDSWGRRYEPHQAHGNELWQSGLECRRAKSDLRISSRYSSQLSTAIRRAGEWFYRKRPSPEVMCVELKGLMEKSGNVTQEGAPPLPEWATKEHEYFSKAERNSKT